MRWGNLKLCDENIIKPQEIQSDNNLLIKGKVLDCNCKPVEGAVILIKSVNYNCKPPKIKDIGYSVTHKDGSYAICVKKIHNIMYRLYVYDPLIKAPRTEH